MKGLNMSFIGETLLKLNFDEVIVSLKDKRAQLTKEIEELDRELADRNEDPVKVLRKLRSKRSCLDGAIEYLEKANERPHPPALTPVQQHETFMAAAEAACTPEVLDDLPRPRPEPEPEYYIVEETVQYRLTAEDADHACTVITNSADRDTLCVGVTDRHAYRDNGEDS
jgi:hypothetical protein